MTPMFDMEPNPFFRKDYLERAMADYQRMWEYRAYLYLRSTYRLRARQSMSANVPAPPPMFSPDYVWGFRAWNRFATPDMTRTIPVGNHSIQWNTPYLEATCIVKKINKHHASPNWDCVCGIYLNKEWGSSLVYGFDPIVGLCRAWGTVIEHEDGYRAEHVECVAISRNMDTDANFLLLKAKGGAERIFPGGEPPSYTLVDAWKALPVLSREEMLALKEDHESNR